MNKSNDPKQKKQDLIDRRSLLTRYGAYTAPIVVSMLSPSTSYAHKDMSVVYSTVAACGADPVSAMGANHGPTRPHCMFNGGGGANSHVITNP